MTAVLDYDVRMVTSGDRSSNSVWNSAMRFSTRSLSRSKPMMVLACGDCGSTDLHASHKLKIDNNDTVMRSLMGKSCTIQERGVAYPVSV